MDFDEFIKPYNDSRVDNIEQQMGVIDTLPALNMDIDDYRLTTSLNNRIQDSLGYWNDPKGYNLRVSRNHMVMFHLGKQVDESRLYRYQVPYIENEMFVAYETIVAYLTAQTPQPEVYPGQDNDGSRKLAMDLEKALICHSEKFNLAGVFESAVRNLLNKRLGLIYLYFDPNHGENGEIIPVSIDPEHVIIDKNARLGENPEFICFIRKMSVEKLISKYPEKEKEIMQACGFKYKTVKQMSTEIAYREVWLTYYDKKGQAKEGCVSYFNNIVLGKYLNPHWIYADNAKNFLDVPMKPFIPINYVNDGSHWIDQTSPMEQASILQDILNKRGRQIMENADTANGIFVFDSRAMTKDDAENLTGDPNQKILVNASTNNMKVGDVAMNIQPHQLPSYVMQDKLDLRNTIFNITGTPSQFRGGDDDQTKTLGQALMIKNQASGRQDLIVRKIDQAATQYFRLLTQMMKVHYTEKHYFAYNGGDGEFDRVVMSRDLMDEKIGLNVKSGSMLPFDKQRQQAIALQLAQLGVIDPYNLYKDLGLPNAQKRYDAFMKWKTSPQDLARDAENDTQDMEAYVDYIELMDGKTVPPREDVTAEHILTHRKQMISDRFMKAKQKVQVNFLMHLQAELQSLERRTALDSLAAQGAQALDLLNPQPMAPPAGGIPQNAPPVAPQMGGAPSPAAAGAMMGGAPTVASVMSPGMANPNNPRMPNMGNPSALPTL